MIYLNNAATSWPKPDVVGIAVKEAIDGLPGHANRGGFAVSEDDDWQDLLGEKMKIKDSRQIVACYNATDALNKGILGLGLKKGDCVLTSYAEHNSVLRPLYRLSQTTGIHVEYCKIDGAGRIDEEDYSIKLKKWKPKLVLFLHASNVTGAVNPVEALTAAAKAQGATVFIDASQTIGLIDVLPEQWQVDLVAFTGHKYLLGPQGTGGLYVRPGLNLETVWVGGTGIHSDLMEMPDFMPVRLEAGTPNEPSFHGLAAALKWSRDNPLVYRSLLDLCIETENMLKTAGAEVISVPGERTPVISFTIPGVENEKAGELFEMGFDIICRTGLLCAPLIHSFIGTAPQGSIRVSLSRFTTMNDILCLEEAVKAIAKSR